MNYHLDHRNHLDIKHHLVILASRIHNFKDNVSISYLKLLNVYPSHILN